MLALLLLLPAIGLRAAIRALIRLAIRALLFGRGLFWRGALSRSGFGRLVVALALIRARAAAFGAPVIAAWALPFARLLARLEAGRALLANPRGRGWAELLFIFGVGRDQPEAHRLQHHGQHIALDPKARGKPIGQRRRCAARQVTDIQGSQTYSVTCGRVIADVGPLWEMVHRGQRITNWMCSRCSSSLATPVSDGARLLLLWRFSPAPNCSTNMGARRHVCIKFICLKLLLFLYLAR
jgi:hypothetical protein